MPLLESLSEFVLALAASPWVYLIVLLVVIIDGFFPPVPSESIVVALGALAISTNAPNLILLVLVTAVGAVIGDSIAYLIGRRIGLDRFQWMRRPRISAGVSRARTALDRRAATLLLTARYVPIGRVVVNMTAGATGFPLRRYLPLASLSALGWSLCTVFIGVLAGTWLKHNPVLGAVAAIVIAFALGLLVDAVLSQVARRRDARRTSEGGCEGRCDVDGLEDANEPVLLEAGSELVR
ncbi:DedA family protein [Leifsonia kafniensis]|uniref:DedA family protein n=1 Tax=Leifsonia kafniensis TaxID=475957 RepID=A0ABP7KZ27_9MICO